MVINSGIDTEQMLNILEIDLNGVDRIVAHNLQFDLNIILSECYRYNKLSLADKLLQLNQYCTMIKGKIYMDFWKSPKLSELFDFIFHYEFKNAHSATADCEACYKCYKRICRFVD